MISRSASFESAVEAKKILGPMSFNEVFFLHKNKSATYIIETKSLVKDKKIIKLKLIIVKCCVCTYTACKYNKKDSLHYNISIQ